MKCQLANAFQKASENFFDKKKASYKKSKIKYVRELIPDDKNDWTFEDIEKRNKKVAEELVKLFITWNGEYEFYLKKFNNRGR